MQCCAVLSRLFQDFSILTRIVRIKQCRCTYSVPNFVAGWDVEYELFDPQDPIPRRAETGVHKKSKKYFSSVECVRVVQFCYILLRFSYLVLYEPTLAYRMPIDIPILDCEISGDFETVSKNHNILGHPGPKSMPDAWLPPLLNKKWWVSLNRLTPP